uniref:Uncharacterized protein n=1 Tax=Onchocerca volvulus TaxID=6282 RepID=A0A8R1XMH5_ONCVO
MKAQNTSPSTLPKIKEHLQMQDDVKPSQATCSSTGKAK